MQLNPRYGPDPIIVIDGDPAAVGGPAIAQRRRLVERLAELTPDQWGHPSRCAGWTNRDVIVHLDSTNAFWSFSIDAGLAGDPTRFLATFDPVASPADLVAAAGDAPAGDVLESFRRSTEDLVARWESLDASQWAAIAEAPPGHLQVSEVTHHALWDSWVHERDILEPLGADQQIEASEVGACLRYAAALGPALALSRGEAAVGSAAVSVTDPQIDFVLEVTDHARIRAGGGGSPDVEADAVELLDALSMRRPLPASFGGQAASLFAGLATTFDVEA